MTAHKINVHETDEGQIYTLYYDDETKEAFVINPSGKKVYVEKYDAKEKDVVVEEA